VRGERVCVCMYVCGGGGETKKTKKNRATRHTIDLCEQNEHNRKVVHVHVCVGMCVCVCVHVPRDTHTHTHIHPAHMITARPNNQSKPQQQ
jgi:hypothetical protein